jgi:hypothetical protein
MNVTEGSRAMLGSPVWYMDVTEGSRAKLGYLVGYLDVTEGSRAMYPTRHPAWPWSPT